MSSEEFNDDVKKKANEAADGKRYDAREIPMDQLETLPTPNTLEQETGEASNEIRYWETDVHREPISEAQEQVSAQNAHLPSEITGGSTVENHDDAARNASAQHHCSTPPDYIMERNIQSAPENITGVNQEIDSYTINLPDSEPEV